LLISREFLDECQRLFEPAMGTESAAHLLYALVRMTRPRTCLEVGLGYTTPFLAAALADAREEFEADRALLAGPDQGQPRLQVLIPPFYHEAYRPRLIAIDDFSLADSSAPRVVEVLEKLGLNETVDLREGAFRGHSEQLAAADLPLDFVWFDCGGPRDYVDFIGEYWPLINDDHGMLVLHFTYWTVEMRRGGETVPAMISSPIIDEIKRQQAEGGVAARFEMLSLVEPHKSRQGSVTLVRKLPAQSLCRNQDFAAEMTRLFGRQWPPFPRLD
jgi:predicted O-methyltransferase YrrM